MKQRKTLYDPSDERDACGVGFVVDTKARKSRDIVDQGLQILLNLEHRGAVGADPRTGDGAGILIQIPHKFYESLAKKENFELPPEGQYATGLMFFPQDKGLHEDVIQQIKATIEREGFELIHLREVPVDENAPGDLARKVMPNVIQVFLNKPPSIEAEEYERRLYLLRRLTARSVYENLNLIGKDYYILSLSHKTVVYKGMLTSDQLPKFYPELNDSLMESALALVHMRFSTNTLPTWELAQPFRFMAHNGEINTVRGNRNWIRARALSMQSPYFDGRVRELIPVIGNGDSDSGSFDRALELLTMAGRSIAHSIMMMIPEAWSKNESMDPAVKDFYEYHATMMEPWDGPAAVAFTDGDVIGATLDRNGLRPARYLVTKDDRVIMASELGVLPVDPSNIEYSGRLQPGKMFLIDLNKKRIISDHELKEEVCNAQPYGEWVENNMIQLASLPDPSAVPELTNENLLERQRIFGYDKEDLTLVIQTMAEAGKEAVGAMGLDNALAVLSNRPQNIFRYFKQTFAQVTNPPIDPIREELVMELTTYIGPEGNLLSETPQHAHRIEMMQPVITNVNLEKIRQISKGHFKSRTLPILFEQDETLEVALARLVKKSRQLVVDGHSLIILSDREADAERLPVPSLLAVSAIHTELMERGLRASVGLVLETGEAREVAHIAQLCGFGANAVNPYLVFDSIKGMVQSGEIKTPYAEAEKNYVKAIDAGLLKILSKMGISTLQSYIGGQVYEAVGLSTKVISKYFKGCLSLIGGATIENLEAEVRKRVEEVFDGSPKANILEPGSHHQYRKWGEAHLLSPMVVHKLQQAAYRNDPEDYKIFSKLVNEQSVDKITLRALLTFKEQGNGVGVEQVEPAVKILPRFQTGAMSFGSISWEAHTNLAIAMNKISAKSNTGEGGEDPIRNIPDASGNLARSAIKQIASGRFGVTAEYLRNADDLQIKMAQGAKPGEGGQLPGHKVDKIIARTRFSTPGVTLISPPPHHDIYSIEDLQQLIFDLKNINPKARISVKLVSEAGVGTVAAGVAKAHADHILISGHDGGTGASPVSSIHYAGTPWELGLAEAHQALVANGLRDRVYLAVDGKMLTGRDVAIAALLGAEEFGFSTSALITQGCIMMRKCHLNTCPVGVATQEKSLREKFTGDPEHLINYLQFVAEELREIMAKLGFKTLNEMVGRVEFLEQIPNFEHWKLGDLDLSPCYQPIEPVIPTGLYRQQAQDHGLETQLDHELIKQARLALDEGKPVEVTSKIKNINRTVGTMLSGELIEKTKGKGLPDDSILVKLNGTAGQSFGAFVCKGITLSLTGFANDYVAKGLSGGKMIVRLPADVTYDASTNIIVGNTCLYGATSGEVYFQGVAGERFAVRNSGAEAVVEGIGEHGCEYMTGGRVIVLGTIGRNFAAGMSGGIAYIYRSQENIEKWINQEMVLLEELEDYTEIKFLKQKLQSHADYTGSELAKRILTNWQQNSTNFLKVIPVDYKRALEARHREEKGQQLTK